jgi:hypothetical protein
MLGDSNCQLRENPFFKAFWGATHGLMWWKVLSVDLKQEMDKRVPVRTKTKSREAANDLMALLEQNPGRVMRCCQDRQVRSAA